MGKQFHIPWATNLAFKNGFERPALREKCRIRHTCKAFLCTSRFHSSTWQHLNIPFLMIEFRLNINNIKIPLKRNCTGDQTWSCIWNLGKIFVGVGSKGGVGCWFRKMFFPKKPKCYSYKILSPYPITVSDGTFWISHSHAISFKNVYSLLLN